MHVVDPNRFPLDAKAQYKPHPHTLDDARTFYNGLGIQNMVLVQPSIYGNDNSCMLEALIELTPKHGRAVVTFDPNAISKDTLQEWHDIGVRGVRINLVSVGREVSDAELQQELEQYARIIKPYNWVLQLYAPMKLADSLVKIVPDLGVKVCLDHFGSPALPKPYDPTKAIRPYALPGFESLITMLRTNTWVKLSAPYRLSQDPNMRDLDAIGRELVKEASNRVVYATDWPHTRFENINSIPFIEQCYEWCGTDTGLAQKLFQTNAEELWDVSTASR